MTVILTTTEEKKKIAQAMLSQRSVKDYVGKGQYQLVNVVVYSKEDFEVKEPIDVTALELVDIETGDVFWASAISQVVKKNATDILAIFDNELDGDIVIRFTKYHTKNDRDCVIMEMV